MTDPLKLIEDKEAQRQPLTLRQDEDKALIYNEKYTMEDWDGKEVPRVYSVTLPNAAIFYSKLVALIAGVSRQPTIESPDLDDDEKAFIIDFLQDMDLEIDARLNKKDELDAFTQHTGYLCARGWSAEQILCRKEGSEFISDVRPLDARWFTYEPDEWGNIRTERTKLDIEIEFGEKIGSKTGIIYDFWDKKTEFIYLDKKKIDERPNPYGYPPFVFAFVPSGPMLKEKDAIKHKGESIFYPHRDMFEEMNFMASMVKTQSFDDLRPALQEPGEKGSDPLEKYPTSQSSQAVGAPLLLVPTRGMTNAMRTYMGIISTILQRAGLSAIDEGGITFPLSAVALARLMAQKQSLILPRHQALSVLYRARTRMILDQIINIGGTIELGAENMKRKYNTNELKGSFTVSWNYYADSLEDRAAKQAIANAEVGMLSRRTIRKDTLQIENPEEEENLLEIEEAKRKEPLLTDLERIFSLIDEDTELSNAEAWIIKTKMMIIARQRMVQGVAEPEAPPPFKPTQQLQVFGGGGGRQPAEGGGEISES